MTLEFNDNQEQALDSAARRAEAQRLEPIMRDSLPSATAALSPRELADTIFAALERAAEWKVQTHAATVDFVILWLMIGPDFDHAQPIESLFVSELARIDTMIQALMSELKWKLRQQGGDN